MTYLEELRQTGETSIPRLCIDVFKRDIPTIESWAELFPHMARPRCVWLAEYRQSDGYHRDSTMIYVTWDQSKFVPSFAGTPHNVVHIGNPEPENRIIMAAEPMSEEEFQHIRALGL